jgi:hypothetical protein
MAHHKNIGLEIPMNDKKIMDKIRKCLALSKSTNEHEAAAALRQAKKLMEAHNISTDDVKAEEVSEARAKAGARRNPVAWEGNLALTVGAVFNCAVIFASGMSEGRWTFIGVGANPEVAQYAFVVLFRQLKRARAEYIKERLNRCKPAAKTCRADLFCAGWVHAVRAGALGQFVPENPDQAAIDAFNARHHPALVESKTIVRGGRDCGDSLVGYLRGKKARLHRGVGGADELARLEEKKNG